MVQLSRLTVQVKLLPLLAGKVVLPLVRAERPQIRLISDAAGRSNWDFPRSSPPTIDHLVVSDGSVTFEDAKHRMNFVGKVSSDETRLGANGPNLSTIEGGLVVANAPWAGPEPLVRAPRLVVRVKLLPLLGGKLVLPLVEADQPQVRLVREMSGRANWEFGQKATTTPKLPPINHLIISGGGLRFDDALRKLSFTGTVSTSETVTAFGHGTFLLQGRGALNKAPFAVRVSGGPMVNIDASQPYPFDARIEVGATHIAAVGIIAHPFDLGVLSGRLTLRGSDLADLNHLSGVALPPSPPYDLSAGFARVGAQYALRHLAGRLGDSDLAGRVTVDVAQGRPFLTADLASRHLRLVDLAAVIGGVPKNTAGHTLSPAQKIMSAKLRAENRILPDTPLGVSQIRTMDARVVYRAQSVDAGRLPVRALSLTLALDHGLLTVDPLALTLPQGDLQAAIRLDVRGIAPRETVDLKLSNARLENLIGRGQVNPPLEGNLFGRVKLNATGDSVRAAAAHANGAVSIVVPSGEIRQAFAELMGIDATKALLLLLSKNQGETPIRCAVADFRAQDGVLTAQRIVLDTGVVLVLGKGQIDLRDETLNIQLNGKPKQFRLIRINAPINIKGSLASPKVGVNVGKVAGQLVISGALAAVVAPLAAILPFVNPGLAKAANCAALLSETSGHSTSVRGH